MTRLVRESRSELTFAESCLPPFDSHACLACLLLAMTCEKRRKMCLRRFG